MPSRFVEADEEFIEVIRTTNENKNTKRSMDYWTNISNNGQRREEEMGNLGPLHMSPVSEISPYL